MFCLWSTNFLKLTLQLQHVMAILYPIRSSFQATYKNHRIFRSISIESKHHHWGPARSLKHDWCDVVPYGCTWAAAWTLTGHTLVGDHCGRAWESADPSLLGFFLGGAYLRVLVYKALDKLSRRMCQQAGHVLCGQAGRHYEQACIPLWGSVPVLWVVV